MVKLSYEKPDSLLSKIFEMPHCFHVKRSAFGNAESDHSSMNQASKSALADESLEFIVRLPIAATRTMKELQLDDQAVVRPPDNQVKAVEAIQAHRCPRLARFPTIRAAMNLWPIDET